MGRGESESAPLDGVLSFINCSGSSGSRNASPQRSSYAEGQNNTLNVDMLMVTRLAGSTGACQ